MFVVRRYIDFLILIIRTPLVLALFCYFFVHFKMFFHSCLLFLCNIANVAQRTIKIVQNSRSRGHGDIIISTSTLTMAPEISTCKVQCDILRNLRADFV